MPTLSPAGTYFLGISSCHLVIVIVILMPSFKSEQMERACAGDEVVTTTSEWGGEYGYR
jgi:hypothetical protein